MKESEKLIRAAGLLATRQRITLLAAVRKSKRPLSAEKIAEQLEGKMNLTTVYRALEQLSSAGLVRRIDLGTNHALFEQADSHHHHLVCRSCGRIEDVTDCIPPSVMEKVLKQQKRFATVEDHSLEFFGVCKPCVKK